MMPQSRYNYSHFVKKEIRGSEEPSNPFKVTQLVSDGLGIEARCEVKACALTASLWLSVRQQLPTFWLVPNLPSNDAILRPWCPLQTFCSLDMRPGQVPVPQSFTLAFPF